MLQKIVEQNLEGARACCAPAWIRHCWNIFTLVHAKIWYISILTQFVMFFIPLHSGSMEPAFHRGDLLFLTNYQEDPIRVGEIVVFKIEGRDIPIVHRVLRLHEKLVLLYKLLFSRGFFFANFASQTLAKISTSIYVYL